MARRNEQDMTTICFMQFESEDMTDIFSFSKSTIHT